MAVSSEAISNPQLITSIAEEIGSQSVVVVLDIKKASSDSSYEVWTHNAKRNSKKCPFELAAELEALGAGEIVINSIDLDGKMGGYDLVLATRMRSAIHIPMTVLGGAGTLADLSELFSACGVVGAAAGSLFVFKGPYKAVLINYPSRAQKDLLIEKTMQSSYRHSPD